MWRLALTKRVIRSLRQYGPHDCPCPCHLCRWAEATAARGLDDKNVARMHRRAANVAQKFHAAVSALLLIRPSGPWTGLTISGVAWIGMQMFSSRPAGDAMAVTTWGSASHWRLTALPSFIWMGENLFRTRLSAWSGR